MQFRRKPPSFRKILVVDGDAKLRASYHDLLVPYGFDVLSAETGKIAIKLAEKHSDLTLIILDIVVPEMDGREFFLWFRRRKKDLPVIVITAQEFDEEEYEESERPAAVLHKPFHPAELLDIVGLFCGLSVTTPRSV